MFENSKDFYMLFFPPIVIFLFCAIYLPVNYFVATKFLPPNAVWLYLLGSALYFISYEVVHFASHLPPEAKILKIGFFRYMRRHHQVHHDTRLMTDYNFNIVFPLCDWLLGTLYRESSETDTKVRN